MSLSVLVDAWKVQIPGLLSAICDTPRPLQTLKVALDPGKASSDELRKIFFVHPQLRSFELLCWEGGKTKHSMADLLPHWPVQPIALSHSKLQELTFQFVYDRTLQGLRFPNG